MVSHVKTIRDGLPKDVVDELIRARHAHGWSQRHLAARVGLPQVHISGIETGKVVPRYDTLLNLVRVLDHDLLLVPRQLVPAVQALIRDAQPATGRTDAEDDDRPLYGDDPGGGDDA